MAANAAARNKRARLPREQRLGDIMAAARAVFVEKGYDEAAMSEIATRAGLVEGSLYRFFDTKRDLLIAVIEASYKDMLADYDRQLAGITGVRNRLRFMIWRLLVAIQENPDLVQLVHRHIRNNADYLNTRVHEQNGIYAKHIDDIVQAGIALGELRADAPLWLVRQLILGGIDQLTWRHRVGLSNFDPDEAADQMTDMIYRALVNNPAEANTTQANTSQAHTTEKLAAVAEDMAQTADKLAGLLAASDT
jgi:AcrR family transcriptional regulator